MVLTTKDLEEGFANQKSTFQTMLDESVAAIRTEIISRLTVENENLKKRIHSLQVKVNDLEKDFESNLQYQRKSNVVITGIRENVIHDELEGIVLTVFNNVCLHDINSRDIVACHRLSKKTNNVLVKFVNSKDATALLDSKDAINSMNLNDTGLANNCEKIYVQEHLSPYISNLAYRCRCLKRENKVEKTKIQKGIVKVLVKDENGFSWSNIQHISDIVKLIPEYSDK